MAVLVLCAAPARAGTLCGHVRDASTGAPIAHAGVFLRDDAGAYLDRVAITDAAGDFCLTDLPGGLYTLEVRVDDYVVAYVTGVEVAHDNTSVPIDAALPPFRLAPPWPNPSPSQVRFALTVLRDASLSLRLHDLRGRVVRAWEAPRPEVGTRNYRWDGRDADGRPVPAGVYLLRAQAAGHTVTRRIVLTR